MILLIIKQIGLNEVNKLKVKRNLKASLLENGILIEMSGRLSTTMNRNNRDTDCKSLFSANITDKDLEGRMQEKREEIRTKAKVNTKDPRYYTIKADFSYLLTYNLTVTHQIGRGGYGVVYRAISEVPGQTKKEVAIKINFKTVAKQIAFIESSLLALCMKKKNVSQLINIVQNNNRTHIITEYFPSTHFIDLYSTLGIEDIKHYLIELLIGIRSLKEVGIFHRDIKPGNFLYNPQTKRGLIIDFGLAELDSQFVEKFNQRRNEGKKLTIYEKLAQNLHKKIQQSLQQVGRHKIGTEAYMPLQSLLRHERQTYESDIWPVGVILLEFVLRKYNIFNHIKDEKGMQQYKKQKGIKNNYLIYYLIELATFFGREAVMQQCKKLGYYLQLPKTIPHLKIRECSRLQGYNADLQELLFGLLQLDMDKRIKVEDAIKHPFFDSVRARHLKKGSF